MSLEKKLAKDLSPTAVKKAVLATATQKPLTVYAATVAALGGGFALAVQSGPIALAALGVGAAVSVSSWLWEFLVKGDNHASNFVQRYRKLLEERRREALTALKADLAEIGDTRGLSQVELFSDKFENFVSVLDKKLEPEELTYNRYLSIAEQVFLGGLDNLDNAAIAQKSVSAIDVDRLEREINTLSAHSDPASKAKVAEMQKRQKLREDQLERANQLIIENEKALTHLDHVSTKIAAINTKQGRAEIDLEAAMDELRRLIVRADNYSN